MQYKLPMAGLAVARFLKVANPEDEYFILSFDSVPRSASSFTSDAQLILDEVERAEANGNTALLDAVFAGLREMKKAHYPRRVMVIVSDGEDNHSRHTRRLERSAKAL